MQKNIMHVNINDEQNNYNKMGGNKDHQQDLAGAQYPWKSFYITWGEIVLLGTGKYLCIYNIYWMVLENSLSYWGLILTLLLVGCRRILKILPPYV